MKPFSREEHVKIIQSLDLREHNGESKASLKSDYIEANTIDIDLDTPLYRIMNIDRLCDLINNKRLGMVHPQRWEDPYEVFLMRSNGVTSQGQNVGFEPITKSLYGLCFSLKPECDGLWRNYTTNSCKECTFCEWTKRHGTQPITVKIKTTGKKLMEAFYDIQNQFHPLCYWIGKVDYCNSAQISQIVSEGASRITDGTGVDLIKTLLVKREPFEYEQEVRLLYYKSSQNAIDQQNTPDMYFFNVDPNNLIEEIEFSPWVDDKDVRQFTKMIKKYYNGAVSRSKLYDEPGIHIKI